MKGITMKKFLIGVALMIAGSAFAANVDVSGLSVEQIKELQDKASTMRKEPESISKQTREELTEWGKLGTGIGQAMISAAKEVGVAANDFAATPLGKVTVAIIVYKMVGRDIIRFVVGSVLFILGTGIGFWIIRGHVSRKYALKPVKFMNIVLYERNVIVERGSVNFDVVMTGVVVMAVTLIVSLLTIF